MNLYEITALQQAAEIEEDTEIKQDLQELIAIELEKKSNNIIYAIKNIECNNIAIDAEIERLKAMKEKNVKNVDSIKNHILNFMKNNNIDKVQTDFINIVAFGKTAELIAEYHKKGDLIALNGSIWTGSYDKEGQKIYTFEVCVNQITFVKSSVKKEEEDDNSSFPF